MPGVCPRCLREVYFAEEKLALGKVWHTFCFSCRNCRKLLDSCTVATHCGELFCRNCCARLFAPSGQPASPPASCADALADTRTSPFLTPLAPVSASDSLSNCCCCCCCAEDYPIGETRSDQTGIRSDKPRLRGGGGGEEEEGDYRLAEGTRRCSESDCSNLAIVSSITALCNSPSSPTAVTAWYNRQHSASQSTFGCQSCMRKRLVRPGTAPHSRANNNVNNSTINSNGINCINGNKCLASRRPGSPCRSVIQQQYEHQNRCNQQQQFLEQQPKVISNNHALNSTRPRSPSRSKSPGGRMAGGCCSSQDNGMVGGCQLKLPSGCECLGGGLDCQRCGRKVYRAEMQIASGVPYHNICFSCFCCRKPLEPLTYQENCGEIYCKQCYVRNFGPQGYGYGVGAGVLQTPM